MLLLGIIVFISCGSKQDEISDENAKKEDVLLSETLNLNVVLSQYGKAKQTVQAPRMLQFTGNEGEYTTFPDGLYVESFTDSLVLESTISAKFAKIKEGREEFYSAYDSVIVTNYVNGTKIITDTLYWDRVNGKIYNYCFTRFVIPSGTFNAYNGMWALENLTDYELRTIREGDLTLDRQNKNDSMATNAITFPDTASLQPQPKTVETKPVENQEPNKTVPLQQRLQKKPGRILELQKNIQK